MAQEGKKNLIGLMVREGLISFVQIDRHVFLKTYAEQDRLKAIKLNHKRAVRKLGADPRKVLNPKGLAL